MEKIIRAAMYIRVSTAEQAIHGKSLQAQKECLEKYAAEYNMKVVGIYADEGKTARKELKKRKAIHSMLNDVKADKIDMILFWKMDRWFRNVSDFYKVQDILDQHDVKWTAVAEPHMTLDTRDGRLQLNIMLSIGQNEVDTTSERIRFTVNSMISNGRLVWGAENLGLGFKIEDGAIVKDPATEHMVIDFYNYFRKYQKKKATVVYMQETYGIDFSYGMLRTMLSSELYIGKYRDNDNYCPAYLTVDEWNEIQQISKRNIRSSRSGRIYLFSGMLRCPVCNQKMSGTGCQSIINRKTGEKRTYCYYRCNRSHIDNLCSYRHRMSQNILEEYLLENLESEFRKYLISQRSVREKKKVEVKKRTSDTIRKELDRLNFLFQKDRIDLEYYESEYNRLEKELQSLHTTIELPKDYSHIESLLQSDFRSIYTNLTQENRQAFWRSILSEIKLTQDNSVDAILFL